MDSSSSILIRQLSLWGNFTNLWNNTFDQADEFTSQLKPASDVSIHAVMSSLYFNAFIFVFLLASYEVLRRLIPSVYAARQLYHPDSPGMMDDSTPEIGSIPSGISKLPYGSYVPFDWVAPVFGISWSTVRKTAGLDAYFFLRFIRMCVRITSVSTFWACIILAPTYATGYNGSSGWYHISMTNIEGGGWRMLVPVLFMYLFSGFTFFVMKQEYSHWMELRMDFLGRGDKNIDPQHHFSLMIENIPLELRSDSALFDYFDKLYPDKIHSASVIMNLPKLEALAARRLRITKRLEKAVARYMASGKRPTHTMGQAKINFFGVEVTLSLLSLLRKMQRNRRVFVIEEVGPLPPAGSLVDSISYYTKKLADSNRGMTEMQESRSVYGETGVISDSVRRSNWFVDVVEAATEAASNVMEESLDDNGLRSFHESSARLGEGFMKAEDMTSKYGSFATSSSRASSAQNLAPPPSSPAPVSSPATLVSRKTAPARIEERIEHTMTFPEPSISWSLSGDSSEKSARLIAAPHLRNANHADERKHVVHPDSRSKYKSTLRRVVGRLGLDFFVAGLKYLNRQLDMIYANTFGTTMSSTGFVTFLDLTSVATAASTPLTHKPSVLKVHVAPEPRDIRWKSVPIPAKIVERREMYANIWLTLGVLLWSIPLTAIQAFATAEQVARIPGMDWVLTVDDGSFTSFINGYLPVVALLCLIMILPIIFERVAVMYEHRKTVSDVQRSMLGRYFYYQLANIYLTVTAGSFWNSLADILDHPGNVLEILGKSLPKVVGYFISLLITKILAGLPIVVLRVGALSRMMFLRFINTKEKCTQRELDAIFRRENLLYGWEYPSQLLVIVICFTYACICPIILPFGAIYFIGSLMVYKKQALYVYIPQYESGGSMFPDACGCMGFGLLCSQMVLLGYTVIRQAFYEPLLLMPLPVITIFVNRYFRFNFAEAATQLSLERAVERDRLSELKAKLKTHSQSNILKSPTMSFEDRRTMFDSDLYRQPVLTDPVSKPMNYRSGNDDPITEGVRQSMQRINMQTTMLDTSNPEDHRPTVILEEPNTQISESASISLAPSIPLARSDLV